MTNTKELREQEHRNIARLLPNGKSRYLTKKEIIDIEIRHNSTIKNVIKAFKKYLKEKK